MKRIPDVDIYDIIAISLISLILLSSLFLFVDPDFVDRERLIAIIVTLFATLVAFLQWGVSRRRAQQEVFLNTLKIMTDKSEAAYLGASFLLKELAKNQKRYIIPAISVIENGIREMSEHTFNDWVNNCVDKEGKMGGPIRNRKTLPAIKEMIEMVIFLRDRIKEEAPPINLGFSDLRILADQNGLSPKFFPYLEKANLRRADLRYLPLKIFKHMPPGSLEGAWFSLNKELILKKNTESSNKEYLTIDQVRGFLHESKGRLFLTGDWSLDSLELLHDADKTQYKEIFKESRIGGGPGIRLDSLNMEDCDFYSATMVKASFRNACLKNANFMEADLRYCDFTDADITNANFYGAVIDGAIFENANVEKAVGLRQAFSSKTPR
jgi:hypothetical protein